MGGWICGSPPYGLADVHRPGIEMGHSTAEGGPFRSSEAGALCGRCRGGDSQALAYLGDLNTAECAANRAQGFQRVGARRPGIRRNKMNKK